jgi:peptide chain release factor 3
VPYPALDASGALVDLAPSRVNLQMAQGRASKLRFAATREHAQPIDHAD